MEKQELATAEQEKGAGDFILAPIAQIRRCLSQPRTFFSPKKLAELAESIRTNGQIQPGIAKRIHDGQYRFELVDGERRWRALQMINRKHMKLVISEVAVDEQSQFTASIVSNFGGEDHTPLEIAAAIKKFQNWGVTLDQIASRFVKSISWVSQHLRILQLSDEVLELMDPELPEDEQLTYSIAIELACLPKKLQFNAARIIMSREMKLAAARNFIRDEADKAGAPCVERRKRRPDDEYRVLSSFLKRVERDINLHSQRTQEFYDSMFSFRSQQDPMDSIMAATRIKEKMDLLSSKIRESVEKQKARYKSQKALRSA